VEPRLRSYPPQSRGISLLDWLEWATDFFWNRVGTMARLAMNSTGNKIYIQYLTDQNSTARATFFEQSCHYE